MPYNGDASAGTMVGAVLETVGYHYQSYLLDQMTDVFTGSLGGFIYLVGVAVTIFAVAIRGGYRFGPWLLIGPPLFLFAFAFWLRSILVLLGSTRRVIAFDDIVVRMKPAKLFVAALLVFGCARILYIVIAQPDTFRGTPISRLLAWLFV